MADREGFEPSVSLTPHTLSKRAHSTTLTSALIVGGARSKKKFLLLGNPFRHFFSSDSFFISDLSQSCHFVLYCDKVARQSDALARDKSAFDPLKAK